MNIHFQKATTLLRPAFGMALRIGCIAVLTGSVVALFLTLLDKVTETRIAHPRLLYLLPFAGLLVYLLYHFWGQKAKAGNNLVIDEIHEPGGGVPIVMTPLILVTTLITHLFGGSAGREGTAVQIGGSMAGWIARITKGTQQQTPTLLMAGIAAGFGAVFGTPLAGAVFALEVLEKGKLKYTAFLPCFVAALLADLVCKQYGIHHTIYHIDGLPAAYQLTASAALALGGKTIIAGLCFGGVAWLFIELMHGLQKLTAKTLRPAWLGPFIGGAIIIILATAVHTTDYLGLGVVSPQPHGVSIVNAFTPVPVPAFAWAQKLLFTVITLGTGFKGGEVTPLFFIGATLGHSVAIVTAAPVALFAGLGFIAVFAGATNTPLACTLMGLELFGVEQLPWYALACFTAYCCSGHKSIYPAQRRSNDKRFWERWSTKRR